jgi:hypothetical protein
MVYYNISLIGRVYYDTLKNSKKLLAYSYTILVDYFSFNVCLILEEFMEIDISKQEAWKLMDALVAYKKDYTVTGPVDKIFESITKKLKKVLKA